MELGESRVRDLEIDERHATDAHPPAARAVNAGEQPAEGALAGAARTDHRDPFAGSLRYHLGLITPNSDLCHIVVDGESYAWRDGEDVLFDETFVHWAENRTDTTRVILFCDVERPLRTPLMRGVNRAVSRVLGQATATQNVGGERVGAINRLYGLAHQAGVLRKRFKRATPRLYKLTRVALVLALAAWLALPWLRGI